MSIIVETPFQNFTGLDGKPLTNGKVYIGQVGTDPTVFANQIPVFWDEALTIPASQPLSTNAGYIVRFGTPSRVYTASDYSMSVKNASNILVYYLAQFNPVDFSIYATYGALSAQSGSSLIGYVAGFPGAVPRTAQSRMRDRVSLFDIGCVGGVDESAKISAILNSGVAEVYVPDGVFIGKAITITSNSLRRITGPGTIKLADGANTFLLNLTGTNDLMIDCPIDGNKDNQSGATPATRSAYILINLTDISTTDTTIISKITNAYYGAAINNSGLRTMIASEIRDCGLSPGTCDAIFNGTASASGAKIVNCRIINCSDYGIACDTSDVTTDGNYIQGCFAGIGSLTRGRIANHSHRNNIIRGCNRPFDYFNASDDSSPANTFDSILIESNLISEVTGTGAAISFAANNATLKLCSNVKIIGNRIRTELNAISAIGIASSPLVRNTNVEIAGNTFIGDNATPSGRYAVQVLYTDGLSMSNNAYIGVDLAIQLSLCTGHCADTDFYVLRDAYGTIEGSVVSITGKFQGISRRALFVLSGSVVTLDAEFSDCSFGVYLYAVVSSSTVYVDRLVCKGTTGVDFFADGANVNRVQFNTEPVQMRAFNSNVVQSAWNINTPPTTGAWVRGNRTFQLLPAAGQSKGYRCTVSGTPGTWVSEGNL